jgi:hypothetical protein
LLRRRTLVVAPLATVARGNDAAGSLELAVRLDLSGVDAGELRHPARERGKLHRLEECDQLLVVGLVHRELGERHLERHVGVERDELL